MGCINWRAGNGTREDTCLFCSQKPDHNCSRDVSSSEQHTKSGCVKPDYSKGGCQNDDTENPVGIA